MSMKGTSTFLSSFLPSLSSQEQDPQQIRHQQQQLPQQQLQYQQNQLQHVQISSKESLGVDNAVRETNGLRHNISSCGILEKSIEPTQTIDNGSNSNTNMNDKLTSRSTQLFESISSSKVEVGSTERISSNDISLERMASVFSESNSGYNPAVSDSSAISTITSKIQQKSSAPIVVSAKRKEELLIQARNDRLQWIMKAPLPYERSVPNLLASSILSSDSCRNNNELEKFNDKSNQVQTLLSSSHVATYMPTAFDVLNTLLRNHPIHEKQFLLTQDECMGDIFGDSLTTDIELALPNGSQILALELKKMSESVNRTDTSNSETSTTNAESNQQHQQKQQYQQQKQHIDSTSSSHPLNVLKSYESFVLKLQDPECGIIVHGMRSFCRSIRNIGTTSELVTTFKSYFPSVLENLKSNVVFNKCNNAKNSAQPLGEQERQTQHQPKSTFDIKDTNHKTNTLDEEWIRRSLESFIYSHCNSHIRRVLLQQLVENDNDDVDKAVVNFESKENLWMDKLRLLAFVEPKHLEIHCFGSSNEFNHENLDYVDQILAEPIETLRSIDRYYAPFEKLQRVLALYRTVNAALSRALNLSTGTKSTSSAKAHHRKLPSADDILPTIILTVLRAQPQNLLLNLKFMEEFNSPEYLRGEAGYAFTNLYGAVQFIQELDLKYYDDDVNHERNNNDGKNTITKNSNRNGKRLSMTAEEYRAGLIRCRNQVENKLQQKEHHQECKNTNNQSFVDNTQQTSCAPLALESYHTSSFDFNPIPPIEIRLARLRGEIVDVDWAMKWYNKGKIMNDNNSNHNEHLIGSSEKESELMPTTDSRDMANEDVDEIPAEATLNPVMNTTINSPTKHNSSAITSTVSSSVPSLPTGFHRNYSFLSTRPEDVRVADLPRLLDEYRMLVRSMETLLAEKDKEIKKRRYAQRIAQEQSLYQLAQNIDPSLLPTSPSSKSYQPHNSP